MLLSFQRPPRPTGKGTPSQEARLVPEHKGGPMSIAPTWGRLQEHSGLGANSPGRERIHIATGDGGPPRSAHAQAAELALADLQDLAVQAFGRPVEVVRAGRLALQPHAPPA